MPYTAIDARISHSKSTARMFHRNSNSWSSAVICLGEGPGTRHLTKAVVGNCFKLQYRGWQCTEINPRILLSQNVFVNECYKVNSSTYRQLVVYYD